MTTSEADVTWIVRVSRFPLATPGAKLGEVTAANRDDALRKAEDHYGRNVVVERATLAAAVNEALLKSPEHSGHSGRSYPGRNWRTPIATSSRGDDRGRGAHGESTGVLPGDPIEPSSIDVPPAARRVVEALAVDLGGARADAARRRPDVREVSARGRRTRRRSYA